MILTAEKLLKDRAHAAHLLANKVVNYKNTDAVVVGVGSEGAAVGSSLANELNLVFEVVLCRPVKDPAHPEKTIGSISDGLVLLDEHSHTVPQDYMMRQVANLKREIENDYRLIYGSKPRPSFKYKTVIPVGDVLSTSHSLLAGLKVIKNQSPLHMIAAIPVVEPLAATEIAAEVNDLVFVHMQMGWLSEKDFYANCHPVDLEEIKSSITSLKKGNL
ncbi:MAG TPA: phosphoribosyltransferase family protein [Cyclobacteriaceae bacterium]|jgi:predicted phosphoribosyltransferase|nr:phosphoribosyltransferase family protein [Cyclobacteriaceae bacterium]